MNKAINHNPKAVSLEIYIHIIAWVLFFAFPILVENHARNIQWGEFLRRMTIPVSFFIIFYTNYWFLVPRYLFKKKRSKYLFYNGLLIIGLVLFLQLAYLPYIQALIIGDDFREDIRSKFNPPPRWIFIAKDIVSFAFIAGLGAAVRMSTQWQKAEAARQKAEQSRIEAELNNLRNQLNPHFLLNTLNNIYALITFDTEKAQQAVQDLSKLLRHVLYENQGTFVPLCKEIDFIHNYIELMRIRLVEGVNVSINIQVAKDSQTLIAPLIFISLIENAFKHGISPTEPSFISITISEKEDRVLCEISNSNHPKNTSDKSGSGIGLEQVKKRLELLYPGRYEWRKGVSKNGSVYTSVLSIKTR